MSPETEEREGRPGEEDARRAEPWKERGKAYQGAIEAVLAILIAAGIGYWADEWLGTAPSWTIVGVAVGFAAFVLRLWRMRKLFEGQEDGRGEQRSGR